jgi:type I restriction enzyme S subunit
LSDIAKEQFIGSGYGGTKIQLSLEDIRELWVVQPSRQDQIEIAKYIESQLKIFSKLIACTEEQIKLLQERRSALISAAVTGKIDVRHWNGVSA